MNDFYWQNADSAQSLVEYLRRRGSIRKRMLLACALCRSVAGLLDDARCLQILAILEEQADRGPDNAALAEARALAEAAWKEQKKKGAEEKSVLACYAVRCAVERTRLNHACMYVEHAAGADENAQRGRVALVHCIFGNPFRKPGKNLACLTPPVVALAHASYDHRTLPNGELGRDRLAALADALEKVEASHELLAHLRGSGPHVRDCHVLDLLTGRS
jgi:hypothetical protein